MRGKEHKVQSWEEYSRRQSIGTHRWKNLKTNYNKKGNVTTKYRRGKKDKVHLWKERLRTKYNREMKD